MKADLVQQEQQHFAAFLAQRAARLDYELYCTRIEVADLQQRLNQAQQDPLIEQLHRLQQQHAELVDRYNALEARLQEPGQSPDDADFDQLDEQLRRQEAGSTNGIERLTPVPFREKVGNPVVHIDGDAKQFVAALGESVANATRAGGFSCPGG